MIETKKIAILGGGNIGSAMLKGFLASGKIPAGNFTITRRNLARLSEFQQAGVTVINDNKAAAEGADIVILAVLPRQLEGIVKEISGVLKPSQILVSVVTAFTIAEVKAMAGNKCAVVRAMPNTAVAVGESMTCLAVEDGKENDLPLVQELFALAGEVLPIQERLMGGATILAACGVAFFMRYIRAASQGGIQVGFHATEAHLIAAQTAKGASKLLLASGTHPETEIDKVTTPMGCTIAGLNEMEHNGLSSALIKGIVVSYNELTKVK
jgi:pyrroline-5-carboxylate reductase